MLDYKKAFYQAHKDELLPKLRERRKEYYTKNRDTEKAKSLARYYYNKGQVETAVGILAEAGVEPPAGWNTPA